MKPHTLGGGVLRLRANLDVEDVATRDFTGEGLDEHMWELDSRLTESSILGRVEVWHLLGKAAHQADPPCQPNADAVKAQEAANSKKSHERMWSKGHQGLRQGQCHHRHW